jgi:hypothetical protein
MAYPYRLFACCAMFEVCYTSELLILYSSIVGLFFFGSLLDLLDTIAPLAKHTLSFHHDRPSFDHMHTYPADRELLHFYTPIHVVRLII